MATLEEKGWTIPQEVAQGKDWFVNWADFPNIFAMPDGRWLTFYLPIYDSKDYGYNIAVQQSKNKGQEWGAPITLYRNTPNTTQGFVSFFPVNDQTGIAWLEAVGGGDSHSHDDHGHDMIVRTAMIDGNGKVSGEQILDDQACTCCQTDAAAIPGGAILVYRDRLEGEIRDISYVRLQNGVWSTPKLLHEDNWEIHGCPVNGPAIDAFANTVAVVWHTASNNEPRVWLKFSQDSGENFDTPIRIDLGNPLGRVDILMLDEEYAIVSWIEKGDATGSLNIKIVHRDGEIFTSQAVSAFEPIRPTGFPRMAKQGNKIYITWTEGAGEKATIKMMSAAIPII
ncbi:MAG: hypothetical protein IPJ74_14920 [Saprospiraceae bacterium]|nr:hypothetical protein [Saprospiraceae bacterium]